MDTAASWSWYSAMDELLGQRHSTSPPVVRASMACISSMAELHSSCAMSSPPTREERVECEVERQERGRELSSFMDFLRESIEAEQAREEERQKKAEERFSRLLAILERIAEKVINN